ncbi:MAG: acetolactate synthase small subunit [Candidatus Anaerobiospirillum merdipullorum]|uniref:Acetolactate synthase small subunit n=1 Tax=Candidatus Anaerobiospirillum merdipullorum TaxID=2838450 RepID=A0A9E2NU72_9GAMM|nr:acetolactate synthase small subunit [Candidatus Anaerobiospirillum merdipullorum]
MRHIVSILLENQNGALSRVVGLFSQRGYNIETISAGPTEDPSISRITIVTESEGVEIEHITKQIHKLINVIKVSILDENPEGAVEREVLFVKVQAMSRAVRDELNSLCDIFNAQIVDVTPELYVLQYVNTSAEILRFLDVVRQEADVIETVRSGVCGIARGEHALHL